MKRLLIKCKNEIKGKDITEGKFYETMSLIHSNHYIVRDDQNKVTILPREIFEPVCYKELVIKEMI